MTLAPGRRLGPYEVTGQIGVGGMGEVYRATDANLKRAVAIKVLPSGVSDDSERLARFQREAEVLATLNHPNIATIYGFEKSDGLTALVMELVEGPTLAVRIAQGLIRLHEALPIARQIAEALQAAHERGIIHRDLKPANVKVRSDGTVKVLDFGLAKILEPAGAIAGASLANSPTLTSPVAMTGVGVLLGTAAYMSPEQARGRPVDTRSDVWAFGCVLFEMLSGRAAFAGETVTDTLSAIVSRDPDWTVLPSDTPPAIQRLLRRCLAKDPHERLHAIADARLELADARLPATAPSSTKRSRLPSAIAAASLVAALAMAAVTVQSIRAPRAAAPAAPELRLEVSTPPTTDPLSIALSPDGRRIVFVASSDGIPHLWLRPLAAETAQPLPGTDFASYPFWSPDSQSIGFFAGGKLKRLDIGGGEPRPLADAPGSRGGTWNSDGVIVFGMGSSGLRRVVVSSGEVSPVTRPAQGQPNHRFPQFLPDGRHFLYFAQDQGLGEGAGVYLGRLGTDDSKHLTSADTAAAYLPPDHVLYVRQGMLVARHLDLGTGMLGSAVTTVADTVGFDGALGIGAFSVSATGMLAYRLSGPGRRQLIWFDRSGRPTGTVGDVDDNSPQYPQLSRDGTRVVIDRTVQNNRDIYLLDFGQSAPKKLTFGPNVEFAPVWSPNGSRVLFRSSRKGSYGLYEKSSTLEGAERLLIESENSLIPNDWSADGRSIVYAKIDPDTRNDLYVLSIDPDSDRVPTPRPFLETPFDESQATFSPNSEWIAYQSNESGPMEIYVQRFPDGGGKQLISTAGGTSPRWRRDGRELFYLSPDMTLMAVPITMKPATLDRGTPVKVFQSKVGGGAFSGIAGNLRPQYDVSADGSRFLMNITIEEGASPIMIVLNWKPK